MIFDDKDIERLRRNGIKVISADGKPLGQQARAKEEPNYLQQIVGLLGKILEKPEPKWEKVEPPQITVKAPDVTVKTAPPPEPFSKWRFELKRNSYGDLTEIIATAIE